MASKTQTTYSQSVLPAWYTGGGQQIFANQMAQSQQPYQAYGGQRIAGFTPDQQQGFDMTRAGATSNQPGMQTAMNATQGTFNRSGLGAAQPYLDKAGNDNFLGGAYGALGQSGQLIDQSTNPTGIDMAQPYLNQAGQTSASQVGQYMNPYIENVVNRYGELGARTLNEQLMPAIQNKYIGAGQLGGGIREGSNATPSGMMTDSARALRDVQEGVAKQQQQALSEGYGQALGAAQTDLSRQGQLAQTAGQLGQQQQNILGNAAQQYGNLGTSMANIGQTQQGINANLAGQVGNLYNQDTSNQLNAAGQLGSQAGALQQQNLTGANAVLGIGGQQQQLQQAGLDTAYQDFLRQQGYGQEQIDNMTKTYQGIAGGVPMGQTQVGNAKGSEGISGLAQGLGTAATIAGGIGQLGKSGII